MMGEENRGIKTFVVRLNESSGEMCAGITSKALPARPAAKSLDHAITSFYHVRLEASALLGTVTQAENARIDFFKQIHRVAVGGLALSMANIPSLRHACFVVASYSLRRRVASHLHDGGLPIISFRTQHRPILLGFAQAAVFEQYTWWSVKEFLSPKHGDCAKHGIVTAFNAVVVRDSQATFNELIDRCGWQGTIHSYWHHRAHVFESWQQHRRRRHPCLVHQAGV